MRLLRFVVLSVIGLLLVGCPGGPPAPMPPCATADACTSIVSGREPACRLPFSSSTDRQFWVQNDSPDHKVFVSYLEKVRHINDPGHRPDEVTPRVITVDRRQFAVLGCERTKGLDSEHYDLWSYTIQAACFVDQCPSPPISKPGKTRDPKQTCSQLCDLDDASCLKLEVQKVNPSPPEKALADVLRKLNTEMLAVAPPTTNVVHLADLVALSNSFTGTDTCYRTDLTFESSPAGSALYPFDSSGSTCPIGFGLRGAPVATVQVLMPGDLNGSMELNSAGGEYSLVPKDEQHAPVLHLLEKASGQLVKETIVQAMGKRQAGTGTLTFTGQQYYCVQIKWQDG
jgi:hypothetical protein